MKKVLILFFLFPMFVFSQGWEKTYGDGYGRSVDQTTDGGYIFATATDSFGVGNKDAWVVKLDSEGTIIWQKT